MQNHYLITTARVTVFLGIILSVHSVWAQIISSETYLNKQLRSAPNDTAKDEILLKIARYYVNKPGSDPDDMKAALNYTRQSIDLSNRLKYLIGIADSYTVMSQISREKGDTKSGLSYAQKAITLFSTNKKHSLQEAQALMELNNYLNLDEELQLNKKISIYTKATAILEGIGPQSLETADALKYLGDLYHVKGDNVKALIYVQKALTIYRSNNFKKLQDIYSLLGEIYTITGNPKTSLKYLLLAKGSAEAMHDTSATLTAIYNRLGVLYSNLNQVDNSVKSMEKAMNLGRKYHDVAMTTISANLAWAYMRQGHYAKAIPILTKTLTELKHTDTANFVYVNSYLIRCYVPLKKYNDAELCYENIKNILKNDDRPEINNMGFHIAATELFVATRQFNRIPYHIDRLRNIVNIKQTLIGHVKLEKLLFNVDSAKGNLPSALAHFKSYKLLSDSLERQIQNHEIAQLAIEYESNRKDLEIVAKNKNLIYLHDKYTLQQFALNSEINSRRFAFIAVGLLALLLVLGFSRYRLKQRANMELQKKQNSIDEQNGSLRQLLTEREWLLKEVHHRVKNNLQIVISLLDSHPESMSYDDAIEFIRESKQRMTSIALIHQKLYQGDDLAGIEMQQYIMEIVAYLQDSYNAKQIKVNLEIDHLILDISQAIPLGLILNESITNILKYAFGNQKQGVINIRLTTNSNGIIEVLIQDNGRGFTKDFDINKTTSLGMNLIKGLSQQLRANFNIQSETGVTINLRFSKATLFSEQS